MVAGSVCELIQKVFKGQCLDPIINKMLLVFITKIQGREYISQFRPVSLCTVLYKIITKTILFTALDRSCPPLSNQTKLVL